MAILASEIQEKFNAFLAQTESWKNLLGSQFVNQLAIFLGWAIEDAAYKNERARQEAFIDTALNRSSLLALAEGVEFQPRRAIPATGKANFTNTGENSFTLLRGSEYQSNSQEIYTLQETIVVGPGETVEASVSQISTETLVFTIEETKPFYEIMFDRDITKNIVSFDVRVAEDGQNFEDYSYSMLLHNAHSDSLVYDIFYHFTDQLGIRFGNGDFGYIPPQGSIVQIDITLTEGDIVLLAGQTLYPVEEIQDSLKQVGSAQIVISETVQNGASQESTESLRKDLHYATVYNNRLVWDNDYKFFLRRRFPDIIWVKVWGEEEAEKMWGMNVDWINRIWFCVYTPDRTIEQTKEIVLEAVRDVPFLCRNFQWYDPEHIDFSVHVEGRVLRDCIISEVREAIVINLTEAYGKNSPNRRETVLLHEIYEAISKTGYFDTSTGAWFEVTTQGQIKADYIYQMLSIDLDNSTINISYVS